MTKLFLRSLTIIGCGVVLGTPPGFFPAAPLVLADKTGIDPPLSVPPAGGSMSALCNENLVSMLAALKSVWVQVNGFQASLALAAFGISLYTLAFLLRRLRFNAVAGGAALLSLMAPIQSAAATASPVSIVAPGPGVTVRTDAVPVTLRVDPAVTGQPLEATLNGKSVGSRLTRSGHCLQDACTYIATLGANDGLRTGKNVLKVRLGKGATARGAWQTSFDWTGSSGVVRGDASVTLPPAVGFTTVGPGGGGANGWVRIYSNKWEGSATVYPTAKTTACTTIYQVLALDRQTLTPKIGAGFTDGYACYDTDQALTNALKTFTQADLVIAGTSYGKIALPQLDTTAIGGTNYGAAGFPSNDYPRGYMVIGVGGVAAGQAYENATTLESGDSSDNWARANGLLAVDGNFNYNFHPSDYVEFKVRPADTTGFSGSITVGNATYTPPADSTGGGFWLLLLDRRNLTSQPGCAPSSTNANLYPNCGTYYQTDVPAGDDPNAATNAWNTLADALKNAGKSQLIFLIARGQPQTALAFPSLDLANAVNNLGGPGYSLGRLSSTAVPEGAAGPALTLVSSNDEGFKYALTGSAIVSTSVGEGSGGGNGGQTGYVKSVLGRDRNGLFRPLNASQEFRATIDSNLAADYTSYPVFWTQPVAWPYMDTPGRVAAYKWLSYTLMAGNYYLVNPSGSHLDDLRFYYVGNQNESFTVAAKDPTTVAFPGASGTTFCWSGPDTTKVQFKDMTPYPAPVCFTAADLLGGTGPNDLGVAGQLKLELGYLQQSIRFLGTATGNTGIGVVITDSTKSVGASMLSAMAGVQSSYASGISTPASANVSKWLKYAAIGLTTLNRVNPSFGVAAGLYNAAAQITAPSSAPSSPSAIPQAFAAYETTLSDLTSKQTDYLNDLQNGLDTARDNVYSDWGKLQTVGSFVANTDGPWYLGNQVALQPLTETVAANAALRYAYLQLLPQKYYLDSWPGVPTNTPLKIGTFPVDDCTDTTCTCFASYPAKRFSAPAWSWQGYRTPGILPLSDIFVIAGDLTGPDNLFNNFTEDFPSADLLSTLFDPNGSLQLSRALFYSPTGPLTRRDGPMYTKLLCFDPN